MSASTCKDCGAADVRVHLGDAPLCDRCADRRVARLTGLPELGAPPPTFVLTGPDGTRHRMQPRPWRAPTGIVVELEEMDVPVGEGFQFSILGPHDAEVGQLLAHLRAHAEAEGARRYLEPNPHRRGWLLAGDEVAGQLVCSENRGVGEPYDVVVDGRTLSWEDLGRTLESFEGWRFRLVIEDRSLDVRPDGDVIAFPAQQQPSPSASADVPATPEHTIDDVLAEFLDAQEQRLAARTFANYRAVIDLLRHCLNGYGHQYLDDDERVRFEQAFDAGNEEAFVHLFGPEKIAEVLGEFLDYFMVRKVMAGESATSTRRPTAWRLGLQAAAVTERTCCAELMRSVRGGLAPVHRGLVPALLLERLSCSIEKVTHGQHILSRTVSAGHERRSDINGAVSCLRRALGRRVSWMSSRSRR